MYFQATLTLGWNEIKQTREALKCISKSKNHLRIIPCHSNLPSSEQKLIFMKPKIGTRKVVLSTNVAETSVSCFLHIFYGCRFTDHILHSANRS